MENGSYLDTTGILINGRYCIDISGVSMAEEQTWTTGNYNKTSSEKLYYATGINEKSKAKNIYDFYGNLGEWTAELYNGDSMMAIDRDCGAAFNPEEYQYVRDVSEWGGSNDAGFNGGFRIVLYIE